MNRDFEQKESCRLIRRICTIVAVLVFMAGRPELAGQSRLPEYGKDYKEELKRTEYPEKAYAGAIYLFDYGRLRMSDRSSTGDCYLERHFRLKILSEAGIAAGSMEIPFSGEDRIIDVDAQTLPPDGKKVRMDKDAWTVKSGRYGKLLVLNLPAVSVGAILEVRFTLRHTYFGFPPPWIFHNEYYTLLSRIAVSVPPKIAYRVFYKNLPDTDPVEDIVFEYGEEVRRYTWTQRDIAPIELEPYMRSIRDLQSALHLQITAYDGRERLNDWEEINKFLTERLGRHLKSGGNVAKTVAELTTGLTGEREKIQALYRFVRGEIQVVEGASWPEQSAGKTLESRKGRVDERNLLLAAMCRAAGMEAYPMLISTRAHGTVDERFANLWQFDRLLAYVKAGNSTYVLDAFDKNCPFDLLPVQSVVEEGFVIGEGQGIFVELPRRRADHSARTVLEATLHAEGGLSGTATFTLNGVRAYAARNALEGEDEQEFVKEMLERRFGEMVIDSIRVTGFADKDAPLELLASYRKRAYAQTSGQMMYVPSPAFYRKDTNPLENRDRNFPVELAYPLVEEDELVLHLPPGFEVAELPESGTRRMEGVRYTSHWSIKDNVVRSRRQFRIFHTVILQNRYPALRGIVDGVVTLDLSQLVLKSTAEGGHPDAGSG